MNVDAKLWDLVTASRSRDLAMAFFPDQVIMNHLLDKPATTLSSPRGAFGTCNKKDVYDVLRDAAKPKPDQELPARPWLNPETLEFDDEKSHEEEKHYIEAAKLDSLNSVLPSLVALLVPLVVAFLTSSIPYL